MYSKSMGNSYASGGQRRNLYRRPAYIPPNYHGTAMTVSPSSPYVELHEPEPPPFADVTEAEERTENQEIVPTEESKESEQGKEDTAAVTQPSLLQGLLSGNRFPFGHGLGYEELLLLGLILFLMREGEENPEEDDRTLPLLLLGALLLMG